MAARYLILGGARSGKTRQALELAQKEALQGSAAVTYVATAQPLDAEMRLRIERHRSERPRTWATLEAPVDLASNLSTLGTSSIVVVDCLTLWLSNAMLAQFEEQNPDGPLPLWERERDAFTAFARQYGGTLIMVSNEVGSGIVPDSALARRFRDEQGRLNQSLTAICDHVVFVVAGLPLHLK